MSRDDFVLPKPTPTPEPEPNLYPNPNPSPNPNPNQVSRDDFVLKLGSVVEWYLVSAEEPLDARKFHPYHQHMSHFQVVAVSGAAEGGPPLAAVGDWRDTLPL